MKLYQGLTLRRLIYGLVSIFLFLYEILYLLMYDVWIEIDYFINSAVGLQFNWATLIFIIIFLIMLLFFKQLLKDKKSISKLEIIISFSTVVLFSCLLIFLFKELPLAINIIVFTIRENIKLIMLFMFAIALMLVIKYKKLYKRKYFSLYLLTLFTSIYFIFTIVFNNDIKIVTGPYLHNPTENSISIGWISNSKAVSWVEYGESEDFKNIIYSENNGLIKSNNTVNTITLNNLEPGKTYYYRIASKKIKKFLPYHVQYGNTFYSDTYQFTMFDSSKEEISFLLISDMHEMTDLLKDLILSQDIDSYDFVAFSGDIFDNIRHERQLRNSFLDPVTKLFAKEKPLIFVRGNHETRGSYAQELVNYFNYPENKYYYSFKHGPASFLILDTAEDKNDDHKQYFNLADYDQYRSTEQKWLEKEISKEDDSTFKIAISHIPLNEYKFAEVNDNVKKYQSEWIDTLDGYLDLLLSGHYHNNEIYDKDANNPFPVILSGGEAISDNAVNYTMLRVEISKNKIIIKFINRSGEVINEKIFKNE
ncbi:MAG: metallophosphoesterase [Anaerorhabdus sp.]